MPVRSAVRTGSLRPFHLPKSLFALTVSTALLYSQDLAPRAYVITPTGSHAIILSSYFNRSDVLVDPTLPIEDGKGNFQVPSLSYYQSFSFFGLSSNLTIALPYAHGAFEGRVNNSLLQTHPSGLADARVRFSVNLNGGPAMKLGEYRKWTEKRLIGVSFTISAPTGQYDPARLINTGTNRWGFQTGNRVLQTMAALGSGLVLRSMALHRKQ